MRNESDGERARTTGTPFHWLIFVLFIYSGIILVGGVMAYLQVESTPSLIWALVATAAIDVAAVVAMKNRAVGYGVAFLLVLALTAFFVYRLATTGNLMPGLPGTAISAIVLVLLAVGHFRSQSEE